MCVLAVVERNITKRINHQRSQFQANQIVGLDRSQSANGGVHPARTDRSLSTQEPFEGSVCNALFVVFL